ncbi:MAG TPA: flagellar hook protein FlgE [Polyangiales bacterium]|nr:flagellar hook protein FlgE [Polyangiales bacterium]
MSILRSLNIGVSGLRSNSEALSVTGDNIANVNTVGFKRSRGVFQDILGRSISTFEPIKGAGAGSRLAHVEQMWTQGSLVTTDSPTDLAIQGDGFFVMEGNLAGADARYYTRAGQFHIDNQGQIVNTEGLRLQGYTADAAGVMGATVGDLVVSQGTVPASATANATVGVNLDANAVQPTLPFDVTNPNGTSNFSNNVTVYDSLGNAHELTVYYAKTGTNSWDWHALVDGGELTGGTAGVPTEGASGTLTFTTDGALDTETVSASSWDFLNATPAQAITFDFGDSITTDTGTGRQGSTQYAAPSSTVAIQQDGYAAGSIAGIAIAQDGTITGVFSNGQQRAIGQVVTADFANVNGLERTGQGMWIQTLASGEALIGAADTAGRGGIVSGALEQANVDLGTEFVNLITYQRGFQANSRVITTADEMYGELVNIKR